MRDTPGRYFENASSMKASGESLAAIVQAIVADGGRQIDLVRVVKQVEGVGNIAAIRLINETGITDPPMPEGVTLVAESDDDRAWLDRLPRSASSEDPNEE